MSTKIVKPSEALRVLATPENKVWRIAVLMNIPERAPRRWTLHTAYYGGTNPYGNPFPSFEEFVADAYSDDDNVVVTIYIDDEPKPETKKRWESLHTPHRPVSKNF